MRTTLCGLAAALLLTGQTAAAGEPEHFAVDTAADLARLCGTAQTHPNYNAAIHFCHGYLVGVHHFQVALSSQMDDRLYCVEDRTPLPTRDTAAADYAAWVAANPQVGEQEALDALVLWAMTTYPCS